LSKYRLLEDPPVTNTSAILMQEPTSKTGPTEQPQGRVVFVSVRGVGVPA